MYIQLNGQILYYENMAKGSLSCWCMEMAKPTKFLMY